MKYKNTKTGAIIDSPCSISGGDWIKVIKNETEEFEKVGKIVEKIAEVAKMVEEAKEEAEEEIEGIEGITVKQIKQELDAFGISFNPKAKKQELYDLMIKGR